MTLNLSSDRAAVIGTLQGELRNLSEECANLKRTVGAAGFIVVCDDLGLEFRPNGRRADPVSIRRATRMTEADAYAAAADFVRLVDGAQGQVMHIADAIALDIEQTAAVLAALQAGETL